MNRKLNILVVEDSPTDRKLVEMHVRRSELTCELQFAETLSEAVTFLSDHNADVVLLDLNLPDSAGLDTFLKVHARFSRIPTVILSGESDYEVSLSALRHGAQDYLPKAEFSSSTLARSIRYAVERQERELLSGQIADHEADLEMAARIQRRLFPEQPPEIEGFDIAGVCQPATAAGGDLFDYMELSGSRWGFVVADVSSHGLGPALIMSSTRRVIRTLRDYHSEPGDLLTAANNDLCEDTGGMHFVTAFLAAIDPRERTLRYAAGGHDSFLIHPNGESTRLEPGGLPLGITEDNVIPTSDLIPLESGQILVLLTDGLAEAMNGSREMFGNERLRNLIVQHADQPAGMIVEKLLSAVHEHCAPRKHEDDLTLVIVKVL